MTNAPTPADHPMMIAWTAYIETPEFANTERWAIKPEHTQGSLWAAFTSGFLAAQPSAGAHPTGNAVQDALIAGFLHGVGRNAWDDMHDYIAVCAVDYAKGKPLPERPSEREEINWKAEWEAACSLRINLANAARPFADLAEEFSVCGDGQPIGIKAVSGKSDLSVGDIRRLSEALVRAAPVQPDSGGVVEALREKVAHLIDNAPDHQTADELADAIFAALAASGDHAELARLAEAATPGPWMVSDTVVWCEEVVPVPVTVCCGNGLSSGECCGNGVEDCEWERTQGEVANAGSNDAAFIAAANPARVLALLAEIAALRGDVDAARRAANDEAERATQAERQRDEATKQISMDDVRLAAGEGALGASTVLAAVNAIIRTRANRYASMEPKT